MKKLLLILFLICSSVSYGQKVLVKGVAINSYKSLYNIQITVNDTLNKYYSADLPNHDKYSEITQNKDLYVTTDRYGNFEINVKPTDSLFFSSSDHFTKTYHVTESYLVSDLLKRDEIRIELKKIPCVEYIACNEESPKLYAFIGKKIEVDYAERTNYCNVMSMDSKYDAKYQVLENLYGDYPNDTVNFVSYDHFSRKRYSDYEYVLIYVADYCGELIHVKYQYNELYKTKDGKWASPYNYNDYKPVDSTFKIQPRKIEFEKPVEIEFFPRNIDRIKEQYPEPYGKIGDGKVTIFYGNYPDELFELKKHTTLKEFGFFE